MATYVTEAKLAEAVKKLNERISALVTRCNALEASEAADASAITELKAEDERLQAELAELLKPQPEPGPTPTPTPAGTLVVASAFPSLKGFSLAGQGEVAPKPEGDRCTFALSGTQNRSELIVGGEGDGTTKGVVYLKEGDEYRLEWTEFVPEGQMTYGHAGAHNLINQVWTQGYNGPSLGLLLWDEVYQGVRHKGLWSHGAAMGGDRFLAPFAEGVAHRLSLHIGVGKQGFYEVRLDGEVIDSRSQVPTYAGDPCYFKLGLYRNGTVLNQDIVGAPGVSRKSDVALYRLG